MLPSIRPASVFPRRLEEYQSHLGPRQAAAFQYLWDVHNSSDPEANLENAAGEVNRALKQPETAGVRVAPREIVAELRVPLAGLLARSGTSLDAAYISSFVMIADWQHETVKETVASVLADFYR